MELQIDIENLKDVITNLNNMVNEYEIIYKNMFKDLKETATYWKDNVSEIFYNELNDEQLKFEKAGLKLSEKIETGNNIIISYSSLGKKIKCNLNSKQDIINKIINIKQQISNLIVNHEKINVPFDVELQEMILKQSQLLKKAEEQIEELKNKIEDDYKSIEINENTIKKRIANVENVIIEEYDNNKYI